MTLFKALFVSLINFTGLFPPGVHCGLKVCFFGVGHAKYNLNNKISKCVKQLIYFGVPLILKGELKDLIAFDNWPLINGL